MFKPRNPIITTLFSLIAASACHRLPLSIGEGIDDALNNPDGSGRAGSGGTGGAPDVDECEADYTFCLESGEEGTLCRGILERCVGGGTAGTGSGGAGGAPDVDECGADYTSCLESGEDGTLCRGLLERCNAGGGAAGTGSGGAYPDDTGVAGAGGRGGSGGTGDTGLDECYSTYELCLESGESPEICRDEFSRCELPGAGGAPGTAGAPGAAGAPGEAGAGN